MIVITRTAQQLMFIDVESQEHELLGLIFWDNPKDLDAFMAQAKLVKATKRPDACKMLRSDTYLYHNPTLIRFHGQPMPKLPVELCKAIMDSATPITQYGV